MSLIRFLFWFLWPAPKIGERWTHVDKVNDPFNDSHHRISDRQGNWYMLGSKPWGTSMHRRDVVAWYRKTCEAPNDTEEVPF